VHFLSLVGRGGEAGADGPDGLVGKDDLREGGREGGRKEGRVSLGEKDGREGREGGRTLDQSLM
jgi:hypothetical protein